MDGRKMKDQNQMINPGTLGRVPVMKRPAQAFLRSFPGRSTRSSLRL
jgi:hypothetical protein